MPLKVVLTDRIQESCADTYSLPLWHYYKARGTVGMGRKKWGHTQVTHRLAVNEADETLSGYRHCQV